MRSASLKDLQMRSPLSEAMALKPAAKRKGKRGFAGLTLTSLVDAFSILLLYLLFQQQGTESTLEIKLADELPRAVKTEALHRGTIVKIEGLVYLIDDQPVEEVQLAARLQELKASKSGEEAEAIIIQADKAADFARLNPVIKAGSISGFNKFKFAVLQGEERL